MLKVATLQKLLSRLSRENRIRAALFMLGWSQRQLAEKMDDTSYTTVRMYLSKQVSTDRDPVLSEMEAVIEAEVESRTA